MRGISSTLYASFFFFCAVKNSTIRTLSIINVILTIYQTGAATRLPAGKNNLMAQRIQIKNKKFHSVKMYTKAITVAKRSNSQISYRLATQSAFSLQRIFAFFVFDLVKISAGCMYFFRN